MAFYVEDVANCQNMFVPSDLQSWIHVCVHFLLFITLGVHSDRLNVNPVTNDIAKLSTLVRETLQLNCIWEILN